MMDPVASKIIERLGATHGTVSTAESLTGGLVCAALTEVPGASAVVRGGVITYVTELKSSLLGVDPGLLARLGAVHPDVAVAMARGVGRLCGTSYGLATTGVAGPEPQDGQLVGRVHVAVACPDGSTRAQTCDFADLAHGVPPGDVRAAIRAASTRAALVLLLAALSEFD